MYERFTDRARKVMQLANQEALRFCHEYIGTEHLLLGLIQEGSGVAANVLLNLDVKLLRVRAEVEKIIQVGPETVTQRDLPHTPRTRRVLEFAVEEARTLNHNYVGTEHILLGLLHEEEGVAAQVLMNLGVSSAHVREEVILLLGNSPPPDENPTVTTLREKVWKLESEVKRLKKALALALLPEALRARVVEMDREFERLSEAKESAVAEQDFERAAELLSRCGRLRKQREALLAEPPAPEVPLPVIVDNEGPHPRDPRTKTEQ